MTSNHIIKKIISKKIKDKDNQTKDLLPNPHIASQSAHSLFSRKVLVKDHK
jgi:hypothetical protein